MEEFKKGFFEIQDQGSQLLSMRVDTKPKDIVVDYCGGSGGKTLAFAPFMHNSGQIFLHDIRKGVLLQAKQRMKRAGVQNVQFESDKEKLFKLLQNRADWVLLDVPCSGTGTLRRNPDMKWKFEVQNLKAQIAIQQNIFDEGIRIMKKKGGRIVYSTCSILPQQNLFQIYKFCKKYNLEIEKNSYFEALPKRGGMDGFFSATLKYREEE